MSRELKVKRLDSPLNRNSGAGAQPADPEPSLSASASTSSRRRRPRAAAAAAPRLTSIVAEAMADSPPDAAPGVSLPDPPALDETLELISSRLPSSLRRSLTELTVVLRARSGERLSQKSLPEQEVLAVLIWAAGSPEDPDAVAKLAASLSEFRARRYAAAAEALRS